ncbi:MULTISPECIES: DUF4845 domain-containing protein [Oleiagrimonas]|jgi:Tfp pilus assembly major pilin PilA|uniref:DUF4845 domain-containing protein n=1 Tax=Oleiagrimonas citrea TaxID=1665687 RepID=A0A846ZLI1_9GAMM|nr:MULTISPECIES: DUF4845 domain-containing protein [Oleiagrimonas]NKZ39165.1 DUF4845 domain-containing protein [Oleiagrimonas citrea]RAP57765.1 DUF4845 domain-containing protein [Oleiagrimonas sp. MCCC 1A03011]
MKSRQKGITLFGFIFIILIAGFFAYMAMKLFPPYYHYMGVEKAMKEISQEDLTGKSRDQIRREFMYKLSFQYADDQFGSKNVRFEQNSGGSTTLHVVYDKRVHFIYNIDFLMHFEKSVPLSGSVE